jgi:hypothetical protein
MEISCKRCGLVNDYRKEVSGVHIKAICNGCDTYIKFIPQGKPLLEMPFGKYKGRQISSLRSKEELDYLKWLLKTDIEGKLRPTIEQHFKSINQ